MPTQKFKASNGGAKTAARETSAERETIFNAFRQWGYLEGDLDPLGFLRPRPTPELQLEGEYAREARAIYSSTIGVEVNHIYNPERRRWIYEQMESPSQGFEVTEKDRQHILDLLIRADVFEQVMQQRYLGSKRFSLEGVTALIPLVDELLDSQTAPATAPGTAKDDSPWLRPDVQQVLGTSDIVKLARCYGREYILADGLEASA